MTETKLSLLLSPEERGRWRSLVEFIKYVDEINQVIQVNKITADIGSPVFSSIQNILTGSDTVMNELYPLQHFARHYYQHQQNPQCSIRHLGASNQADGEIKLSEGKVEDLEVTLAGFEYDQMVQIKNKEEIQNVPATYTKSVAEITDAEILDAEEIILAYEKKILKSITRKLHNNSGCWLIISFRDVFFSRERHHKEILTHQLLSHSDKSDWLSHFSRLFVIGSVNNFFLEIV